MTNRPAPRGTSAVSRALSRELDPLSLYALLSANGGRQNTMLFERSGGVSLVLDQAALRIESRGADVTVLALSPIGQHLLTYLQERLADRAVSPHSAEQVVFRFPEIHETNAEARLTAPSPFDVLRSLTVGLYADQPGNAFATLCMGVIAYDHIDFHEHLPPAVSDPLDFPDFLFWVPESLVVFEPGKPPRAVCSTIGHEDAGERLADLVAPCESAPSLAPLGLKAGDPDFSSVDMDDGTYETVVAAMKAHIREGEVYQIVPSRTFSAPCPDAFAAFRLLHALEQTPYRFFMHGGACQIFGASPEAAVRVSTGAGALEVETNPIAGTRGRGSTADEDDRLEVELRTDAKEIAEHLMLVDLARNDVARISIAGTRHVPSLMHVQRHARVMHLASTVTGTLRPGLDGFHALQACLNVGTLTGAPKIRAMQLLREAELSKRGPYGGGIGWFNGQGALDSAVIIRTAIVRDGTAFVRAGAGIVHDSDPKAEAEETRRKAAAVLSAIAGAAA